MKEFPESYCVGQEYIEDSLQIDTLIKINCYSPALLEDFDFYLYNNKIYVNQIGGELQIKFNKKISNKLLNDIKKHKGECFIIGYISKILPKVNHEILKQRYENGHFLIRSFSILDIYKIVIIRLRSREEIILNWPVSIDNFPPSMKLVKEKNEIFIKDLIDAGNLYFNGNYDDCIRKIITSVENSFRFYNLKGKRKSLFFHNNKFNNIIKNNISGKDISQKVIASNLIFIYKIRCKIVHDKFRIKYNNGWICKKGIGTLFYLYQFLNKDDKQFLDYVLSLQQQFLMLDMFCQGINLEDVEKLENRDNKERENILNTHEEINKFMFSGLKINSDEQLKILRN